MNPPRRIILSDDERKMEEADQIDNNGTAEFRAHTAYDLHEVKYRMQHIETQHIELRKAVADNTALTINNTTQISNLSDTLNKLANSLGGLIKISTQVDGTLELGSKFGKFAIWIGIMATLGTITWAVFKYIILEAVKK